MGHLLRSLSSQGPRAVLSKVYKDLLAYNRRLLEVIRGRKALQTTEDGCYKRTECTPAPRVAAAAKQKFAHTLTKNHNNAITNPGT